MHSNRYNRLQKKSTSLFQPNADSMKTNIESSNTLQFYSFNKKYNHTAFCTENCFDMSQSVGMHYERKYDRDNDGLIFNDTSQLRYNNNPPSLCHPVRSNEISNNNTFRSNSLKTNLFSQINETKQITPLSNDTMRNLGVDDIKANFNASKLVERPVKFSKKLPTNSFPVTNLASSMKRINGSNEVSKTIKTDLSLNSAQISNVKENSIELLSLPVNFKSPLENSTNLRSKSPNMLLNSEFVKFESLVTPITDRPCTELFYASSPTASDVTRNFTKKNEIESAICINETIGTYKDKCEEHKPKANCQKDKFDTSTLANETFAKSSIPESINICNEINCSMLNAKRDEYEDRSSNIRNINDYQCEDKCTSTIDNALDILQNMLKSVKRFRNKDMKKCNDQNYQFEEVKCKNMDCIYKNGRNKVLLAKINSAEITRPKCTKMLREIKKHADTLEEELTIVNKSIRTKKKRNEKLVAEISNVKQRSDMITQNPEKKNIYIQESCSRDDIKYFQSPLLRLETNVNSQHVKRPDVILSRIHKKGTYKKDHDGNDNSYERNNVKSLIHPGDNYSTNVKNAHVQCARSVSFRIFDSSNFTPIATSTPRKIDAPKNKETLCYVSTCTQTTSISDESLQIKQIKKTTSIELKDYSVGQVRRSEDKTINSVNVNKEISSCCDEKAIIMLFLTKKLSSKCSKTKYKRSEFLNFRSKRLTDTCVVCGKKLIKYRLSRRKKRIPVVFKLMSVTYKSEAVLSNENHCDYEKCLANNCKVSDLLNTVYTQSSNLQITTATSVPCISVGNTNNVKNFDEERIARNDGCVLS